MTYIESSISISGKPEEVYSLASDMEKYPQYMPDVESVKILKRESHRTITEWATNVEGTSIIWKEEDLFHDEERRICYRLIEGDLEKFEGEWRFMPVDGGTLVTLSVDYDFGIPSLTELIGPTLELKVRQNSEMMLQAMKEKIEHKK